MMFNYRKRNQNRAWVSRLCGTVAVTLLFSVAFASEGLVHDRRVTMDEAQKLLVNAQAGSQFPIVLNAAVLEQLNRFIGTPDGRDYMKNSIARKASYEPYIEDTIKNYTLPEELDAIPITESGYKNTKSGNGTGIWSFIPQTARNYGMQVTPEKDDRLDYKIETVGAMRLLSADHLRFQDWQLAILAYNAGEKQVQAGIDATGSRDVWKLIEAGYDGDQNYLAKVMAAIIIEKNPSVLD